MIWPPMIQVIGTIAATNSEERDDPHHADVLGQSREEVEQQDLDPVEGVEEHRGDEPELQQPRTTGFS